MADENLTPTGALREFRRQSPEDIQAQAKLFRSMSPADQRELLFYMCQHNVQGLMHVHSLIVPQKITPFNEFKTDTH